MDLLKQLCQIQALSGNEAPLKEFIIRYIETHIGQFKVRPQVIADEAITQDGLILVFGRQPRTAIFAHLDSVGFTVRYNNGLVKAGKPRTQNGYILVGHDSQGAIETALRVADNGDKIWVDFDRNIEPGTDLSFQCDFRTSDEFVQSCYLDNRFGCWLALQVAKTLENGIICFSTHEEHGGGSALTLGRYIYEQFGVRQALIADITWVTEGIKYRKGPVISVRDSGIPRRKFINHVIGLAKQSGLPFQIEVEATGGSDGSDLQRSPYPFDWCFIGAPQENTHSPDEKMHKSDLQNTVELYSFLMKQL